MPVPAQAAGTSDGAAGLHARPLTSSDSARRRGPESWSDRVRKARALAILFAAGGSLVLITLLLPHDRALSTGPVLRPVVLAFALAGVLYLEGGRLPNWTFHLFLGAGTVLVSTVVYFGSTSGNSITYPVLYGWVALYAFYFFSVEAAVTHLVIAGALYASIVQLAGGSDWLASLVMTFGVVAVTGMMIGWLVHQIRRLAQADDLTGLANRRTWDIAFDRELLRAERHGFPVSLAVLDLDGFKQINDLQGHQAGDQLLKEVAMAWQSCLRTTDMLARIGGDEFALLLPDCRLDEAQIVGDRLRAATRSVRYSVGVTSWDGLEVGAALVHRADQALYEAKRSGGNRTVFVSEMAMPILEVTADDAAAQAPARTSA